MCENFPTYITEELPELLTEDEAALLSEDDLSALGRSRRNFLGKASLAAVAAQLGLGFVPIRKPGKLPVAVLAIDYALEYGTDRLELDPGAIGSGQRVVIIDDLIATGGTALATTQLLRRAGATVDHALFVIDLPDLGGAERLREAAVAVRALMEFAGH